MISQDVAIDKTAHKVNGKITWGFANVQSVK